MNKSRLISFLLIITLNVSAVFIHPDVQLESIKASIFPTVPAEWERVFCSLESKRLLLIDELSKNHELQSYYKKQTENHEKYITVIASIHSDLGDWFHSFHIANHLKRCYPSYNVCLCVGLLNESVASIAKMQEEIEQSKEPNKRIEIKYLVTGNKNPYYQTNKSIAEEWGINKDKMITEEMFNNILINSVICIEASSAATTFGWLRLKAHRVIAHENPSVDDLAFVWWAINNRCFVRIFEHGARSVGSYALTYFGDSLGHKWGNDFEEYCIAAPENVHALGIGLKKYNLPYNFGFLHPEREFPILPKDQSLASIEAPRFKKILQLCNPNTVIIPCYIKSESYFMYYLNALMVSDLMRDKTSFLFTVSGRYFQWKFDTEFLSQCGVASIKILHGEDVTEIKINHTGNKYINILKGCFLNNKDYERLSTAADCMGSSGDTSFEESIYTGAFPLIEPRAERAVFECLKEYLESHHIFPLVAQYLRTILEGYPLNSFRIAPLITHQLQAQWKAFSKYIFENQFNNCNGFASLEYITERIVPNLKGT